MNNEKKAFGLMVFSTMSMSLGSLLSKQLAHTWPVALLSFLRFISPALLMLALLRFHQLALPSRSQGKAIFARSCFIAICQMCFIASLQTLTLVESVVLFATGPLFMPLLDFLFLKGKIQLVTIMALLIAFSGVLFLAQQQGHFVWRLDLLLGLGGGFFNAASQLALHRMSKGELSPLQMNFWAFFGSAVLVSPLLFLDSSIAGHLTDELLGSSNLAWVLLGCMALCVVLNQVFRSRAYRLVSQSSQLAPLIFLNLIFSAVWQWLFFDKGVNHHQLIGISLIVSAILLNMFGKYIHWERLFKRKLSAEVSL